MTHHIVGPAVQRGGAASFLPQIIDTGWSLSGGDPIFNARNSQLVPLDNPTTSLLFKELPRAIRGVASVGREDEVFSQADMRALLRLSPGRNILGYSNLLRLLEQPFPEER